MEKLPGDSPYATSASLLMDAHYERLGIRKRWNRERVDALWGFLRMNYGEIASLVNMNHRQFVRAMLSTFGFPGPLCILLTIIEDQYMSGHTKDTISNIFNFSDHGK